jgi:hypothetical protein
MRYVRTITDAATVNKQYDYYKKTIERTAFSDARPRLLFDNEVSREKCLQKLEKEGQIIVEEVNMYWRLIEI